MKLIEFIKLILKHKVAFIAIPTFVGILAVLLTNNPKHSYYSETKLYTGLASGSSIEMDKSFNYFATNIAFDNLINIINSRETQEEVAIRLLSQHLLLSKPNSKFISDKPFEELKADMPKDIYRYVVKSHSNSNIIPSNSKDEAAINTLPENVSRADYEQTVANLMKLMKSNNKNFVYSLLNFDHPYYSLEAISKIKAVRISTSDLVELSYETGDPGVCQQTLAIFNEVCIKKYKNLKENGSDAVVKYFETQLKNSESKLKKIEDILLKFNQDNGIINYYEQSKAVAIVKEDMDVEYSKKRAELAGSEASSKKLEQKLEVQELVQEKSNRLLENKKRLGELNYEIVMSEAKSNNAEKSKNLEALKKQASQLQNEIKSSVSKLYSFQNSVEGVPTAKILPEWVDKVVETENLKAKLQVMNKRNGEFAQQYAKYAPAGANLKKIERQINVAEQEYLEILHGLNLAKLKFQDTQLSSNLKAVDTPYFPLKPIPSKRKIVIIAIIVLSFILLLGSLLVMEFFDNTLKNVTLAEDKLKIPALGMLSKVFKTNGKLDLISIQDRLMELVIQNLNHALKTQQTSNTTQIITILSTQKNEGKTVIATNIAKKLKYAGKSVVVLNHSDILKPRTGSQQFPLLSLILGYQDPRIDYAHPFLANPTDYLDASEYLKYEVDRQFYGSNSYDELTIKGTSLPEKPLDYVIIELPNVLDTNYPADLIVASDLVVLVCRSNRLWSKADENLLNNIKELTPSKLQFIINGVELDEVESLLGELPKKRSKVRSKIKNILRFQFHLKNHI
jgi:succinoglycan biosynthesis transport protein ExoP